MRRRLLQLLLVLCLALLGCGTPSGPAPAATPLGQTLPATLVGSWTSTGDRTITSYVFRADGSYTYTLETKTDLQCGFNTVTTETGTARIDGPSITLQANNATLQQEEACSGATRSQKLDTTTQTLIWHVSSGSGGVLTLGDLALQKQ